DVTLQARALDRQFIDGFPLERFRGYAKPHDLIIDADGDSDGASGAPHGDTHSAPQRLASGAAGAARGSHPAPPDLLLLTGWTDYAFSSDNVAATQAGLTLTPPSLDLLDAHGEWRTVVKEIGIPVGRPQTLVVDLNGKWPAGTRNHLARIRTNMRI